MSTHSAHGPRPPPRGSYEEKDPALRFIHAEGPSSMPIFVLPNGAGFMVLQEAIDRASLLPGVEEARTRTFQPKPLRVPGLALDPNVRGNYGMTVAIASEPDALLAIDTHLPHVRDAEFPAAALLGLAEPARELPSGNRLYPYEGGFALVMGRIKR